MSGINCTIGLPVIRTSVDYGTAYGKAGEGIAIVKEISGRIPAPIGIGLGEPALVVAIVDTLFMAIAHRMTALTVRYLHGSAITSQNKLPDIQKIFMHRTCHEDLAVDFTDDGQLLSSTIVHVKHQTEMGDTHSQQHFAIVGHEGTGPP